MKIILFNHEIHSKSVLDIFKTRPDIFPESEIDELMEELKTKSTDSHLKLVAMDGEDVAGYTAVKFNETEEWYLHWLGVNKYFEHQGVGSMLFNYISDWLTTKGVKKVTVQTCACAGECPARNFYIKHGFTQTKIEANGYGSGHDKITFEKNL